MITKADVLTFCRIPAAPVFLVVFCTLPVGTAAIVGLALAVMGELSDILDGYYARKEKVESDFGKLMDPYADSILRLTIFFSFAAKGWIPVWMAVILLYRDILTSVVRTFAIKKNIVVAARISGKIKAISQGAAIIAILLLVIARGESTDLVAGPFRYIGFIVVAVAVWSAADYLLSNRTVFATGEADG